MAYNHRSLLRFSTDLALSVFLVFSIGGVLWVTDEFLGWNVLPDWIDRYAQLIVLVFGMAAALAVGTSLLCSVVVVAESLAQRAGLEVTTPSSGLWRVAVAGVFLLISGLAVFQQIHVFRKDVAQRRWQAERWEGYRQQVADLHESARAAGASIEPELLSAMQAGIDVPRPTNLETAIEARLKTYLSALHVSLPHRPDPSVLLRAPHPYRYVYYQLREDRQRNDGLGDRWYLESQWYTGFPSPNEVEIVRELFDGEGRIEPVNQRLEGAVIDTVHASSWKPLVHDDSVVGLLVLRTRHDAPGDGFHQGPSGVPQRQVP